MSTVNILHLSDLHFGILPENGITSTALERRDYILNKLIAALKKMKDEASEWTPDVIALSGDLGWKGQTADYNKAQVWIQRILEVLELPAEAIAACPGNHDINRMEGMFTPPLREEKDAASLLAIEHVHRRCQPFQDYVSFLKGMGVPPYKNGAADPKRTGLPGYLYGYRSYKGFCFAVLNSAWNCRGDEDLGNLWLGEPLAFDMLKNLEDAAEPVICLFHHPFGWLNPAEQRVYGGAASARDEVLEYSDILLNGHVHGEIRKPDLLENKVYAFTGGALYEKDMYKLSGQIIKIDGEGRRYSTCLLCYDGIQHDWNRQVLEEEIPFGPRPSGVHAQPKLQDIRKLIRDRYFYYHDSISPAILPPVKVSLAAEDGELLGIDHFMEWIGSQERKQIQLIGEGGMGKTSFLLELCGRLHEDGEQRALFVNLNEVNDLPDTEAEGFLDGQVEQWQSCALPAEDGREPVLLLDGFNEVKASCQGLIAGQIRRLMDQDRLILLLTSRQKLDGSFEIYRLPAVRMEELGDEQIREYLAACGLEADEAAPFWQMLRTPMLLTIYCRTSGEYIQNLDTDYFRFNRTVRRKGELICNYLEGLVGKRLMQNSGTGEKLSYLALDFFVMYFILPGIAWHMVEHQLFAVGQEEIYELLEDILEKERREKSYYTRWFAKRGIGELTVIDGTNALSLMKYLSAGPSVFCKNGSWMFKHQDYRDVAAAFFIISDCEKALIRRCVPESLKTVLPAEIAHLTGDVLHDYEFVPGRRYRDPLHGVVDLLRGRDGEEIKLPLFNILQIWRYSRGTLSGEDFSSLDLKGQILYPYLDGKQGKIATNFDGAAVYLENFFPPGHNGHISNLCYSPDGTVIATAADDDSIRLWDAHTGELRLVIEGRDWVTDLIFSPDGTLIAASGFDSAVCIWDSESGELVREINQSESDMIDSLSFHPSGRRIAAGSRNGLAHVWDVKSGSCMLTLPHYEPEGDSGGRGYVSEKLLVGFSPDGQRIVTAFGDGTVKMWDVHTGAVLYRLKGHTNEIRSVEFTCDGTCFLTGSMDCTACVWETESGRLVCRLEGHIQGIFEARFSQSGRYAATASADDTARIWDIPTGEERCLLSGHSDVVQRVGFSPDERYAATSSCDETAAIWETDSGRRIYTLAAHRDIVGNLSYSPDGRFLATGSVDGNCYIWNAGSGEMVQRLGGDTGDMAEAFFSGDERRIVTIDGHEDMLRSWRAADGGLLFSGRRISWPRCVSPDGEHILMVENSNTILEWDIRSNCPTKELEGEWMVKELAYSPDGTVIAAVDECDRVTLREQKSGLEIAVLEEAAGRIQFSYDGKYLLGIGRGSYTLWETVGYRTVADYRSPSGSIHYPLISFTADSSYLAGNAGRGRKLFIEHLTGKKIELQEESGYRGEGFFHSNYFVGTVEEDCSVLIRDYSTGAVKYRWKAHRAPVKCICFAGARTATASEDGMVCIWNMEDGEQICALDTGGLPIYSMSFSAGGNRILGLSDNQAFSWNIGEGRLETIVDHRFNEKLMGCRMNGTKFQSSLTMADIALLNRYAV